jgi:hypothetical protein
MKKLFPLILLVLLCSGCASMLDGNQTTTTIATDVPARIIITDNFGQKVYSGVTPFEVTLKTFAPIATVDNVKSIPNEYSIRIQEIANKNNIQKFKITAKINPKTFLNICFLIPIGFPMGFGIEYISGAAFCFEKSYQFNISHGIIDF